MTTQNSPAAASQTGWMVSTRFDLLFLANLWWTSAFLLAFASSDRASPLEFWQLYFLTAPHRWITLVIVACDPARREGRNGIFAAIPAAALLAVGGAYCSTGTFLCLLLVDYVWNSWHFAAQHYGILRIYSRKASIETDFGERYLLRTLVVFTALRLAAWTIGWAERSAASAALLSAIDAGFLALAAGIVVAELVRMGQERSTGGIAAVKRSGPRRVYLVSVASLYGSVIAAVMCQHQPLIRSLAVASAAFHATEYLAIVTYYARRSASRSEPSLFKRLAAQWGGFLLLYVSLLGAAAVWMDRRWADLWLGLNLWAAFIHYAYDGLIWKLRRPKTAQDLGVAAASATHPATPSRDRSKLLRPVLQHTGSEGYG